ncbi:MAG: C2H2-type zinc finger protein [Ignisphaera sp.]
MKKLELSLDSIVTKFFVFDAETRFYVSIVLCLENAIDKINMKICPYCGKKFKTGYQLSAHISNNHPDEIIKTIECAIDKIKKWRR